MNLDNINKCLINLPHRTDRLEKSMDEISSFFKNHSVTFIEGIRESVVFRGIASSHINAVSYAKHQGWPEVLIIEDDVNFQSKKSREYADKAFQNLPDNWDLLLSSVYVSKGLTQVNEFWEQTKEFCGLTFYVVNSKAYDKILAFDKSAHIDRAMVSKLELKCFVVKEFFAIQHEGISDHQGEKVNYENYLKKFTVLK